MSEFDSRKFSSPRLLNWHGYKVDTVIDDSFLGGRIPSVEFVSGATVWVSTSEEEGNLQPEYLLSLADRNEALQQATVQLLPKVRERRYLDKRPIFPQRSDVERLRNLRSFDRAVDALTECQRGVKEKQAWLSFMERWMESPHQSERRYPGGVNPADDTLVGVWVNGKNHDLVNWFLVEAYMPCFFISELPRSLQGSRTRPSFMDGTNLDALLNNEFHRIASSQKMVFTETELYTPFNANIRPDRDLDRAASSLHWQLDVPWAYPLHETDNVNDAFHCMEIPPISGDAVSKGKWTVYAQCDPEEEEPDVGPTMRSRGASTRGKGDADEDDEIWYDRSLKRKLIFSDLPPLPHSLEHVDDEFGRPVPGWVFGGRRHQEWVNDAPSVWMYRREKASRPRVGERYYPPTPQMLSPTLENPTMETTPAEPSVRDNSPSEGSVVSLGPEEDVVMEDVGNPESPDRVEAGEIPAASESTYVLIHGHSFSFGLGDLRLWLRHPSTGVVSDSVAGIYRLLQSDYRVDYFFEVRDARNAELLLRAGERSARSSGARYLNRESFEQATIGLRREEVDVRRLCRRELRRLNVELPRLTVVGRPHHRGLELSVTPSERPNEALGDDTRVHLRHDRDKGCVGEAPPDLGPGTDAIAVHPLLGIATRDDRENDVLVRRIVNEALRLDTLALLNGPVPLQEERSHSVQPDLAARLTDPIAAGRMAARAVWDVPSRAPPTAPRAERLAVRSRMDRAHSPSIPEDRTRSLLHRMTEPMKPLLERLQPASDNGNRALMDRMEIGLKDRVSTAVSTKRKRAHNQPQKRLERLLRMEEDIRREREEFRWTDAEIDWFIDQEDSLPAHDDEDDDRMKED
ncbi:hypothetical protein B0H14DRAFT_3443855 [Mycena olivaceomarginata]|nr:hypothetical protein B0H14DRAFT_3443855 [Mycena olivaceomarginata]